MYICLHDHTFGHGFCFMVILRSTTGSYGRLIIEVAYEKILFHSTEAVWEVIAREEWLGCRHDVVHVGHIRVNTSVGSIHIIFGFSYYKNLYVLCLILKTKYIV